MSRSPQLPTPLTWFGAALQTRSHFLLGLPGLVSTDTLKASRRESLQGNCKRDRGREERALSKTLSSAAIARDVLSCRMFKASGKLRVNITFSEDIRDGLEGFDPGHTLAQDCVDGDKATRSVLKQKLQMQSSLECVTSLSMSRPWLPGMVSPSGNFKFSQWGKNGFTQALCSFCKNGVPLSESVPKIILGYLGICDESCLYS